jgi:DNA-binding SARP family transcriptional activator/tetratricopeptide (TPR) repeat protein
MDGERSQNVPFALVPSQTQEPGAVRIYLLGSFQVTVDGEDVPAGAWPARRAAELVQLLALADGRRLARDRVIEALWPTLDAQAGAANLRKAAHHARQALGHADAVVLAAGQVSLFPGRIVTTDVERFERSAGVDGYGGELLPDALYEQWTQAPRERLRALYLERLRGSEQWERVVEVDPTDEQACRELMRRALADGSRPAAIRWYGRLRTALRRELGIAPGAETTAVYEQCLAGLDRRADPAFVGRQLELAAVDAALRAADVAMIAVRGPAGIGKSAFCRELTRLAAASGCSVTNAVATEVGGPYAPLSEAAARLAADDPGRLERVGEAARIVLAQLLAPPTSGEHALTRHRVIGAIGRLLRATADRPLVALDDAHLADDATLDVLQHLAGAGVVIVVAYRPEGAPELLTRALARVARAGRAEEIDLGPLDDDEIAVLAGSATTTPRSAETVQRIIELGRGNPFLTLELARSSVAGVPALAAAPRDAITARLVDLDEPSTAVLRELALAGDDLDAASAVALAGDALDVLDVALARGVLVVDEARYRFRHDLVRQALIEQIAPHQRLALHREIAARLGAAGAAPGLIARHLLAGGRAADAVDWLLAASREAITLGAYADAVAHLDPLLRHAPEHGEALRLRAEALDATGDIRAPAVYAKAANAIGRPLGDDLRAKGALAQIKLGDAPGGLHGLEGLEPSTLDGRIAHALGFAGAAALGFGDPAVGNAKAAEARKLALSAGDPAAVAVASWAQAAAAHASGVLRESVRAVLQDTSALPQLAVSAFDGQLCITQRLLYGARPYDDVIAFADALEVEARRLGAARGRAFAVTIRGEAKLLAGRLDAAEADLVEGAMLHRMIAGATGEAFALQRRAELHLHRGRYAEAMALLDEALAIARESDVGFHLFDRIYGTKVGAAADPAAGLAALEEAEEAVRGPVETCPGCRITLAMPAAIAAVRAGDETRARHWTRTAEYLATTVMRLPAWDAALEELRGHQAHADGACSTARAHFRAAADGFASAEQPLDEARCRLLAT